MTEPDTAAILFDNAALPDKSLTEHLEAKNHQTALNYLFDHIAKKYDQSQFEDFLCDAVLDEFKILERNDI